MTTSLSCTCKIQAYMVPSYGLASWLMDSVLRGPHSPIFPQYTFLHTFRVWQDTCTHSHMPFLLWLQAMSHKMEENVLLIQIFHYYNYYAFSNYSLSVFFFTSCVASYGLRTLNDSKSSFHDEQSFDINESMHQNFFSSVHLNGGRPFYHDLLGHNAAAF